MDIGGHEEYVFAFSKHILWASLAKFILNV